MKRLLLLAILIIASVAIFLRFNAEYLVTLETTNPDIEKAIKSLPEGLDKETLKTFN